MTFSIPDGGARLGAQVGAQGIMDASPHPSCFEATALCLRLSGRGASRQAGGRFDGIHEKSTARCPTQSCDWAICSSDATSTISKGQTAHGLPFSLRNSAFYWAFLSGVADFCTAGHRPIPAFSHSLRPVFLCSGRGAPALKSETRRDDPLQRCGFAAGRREWFIRRDGIRREIANRPSGHREPDSAPLVVPQRRRVDGQIEQLGVGRQLVLQDAEH